MSNIFQSPPGTRDFYPEAMAVRRYIEDVWRRVSIRHGFVEVDGPTFEFLDLYKIKSGDEIVSQLFHFESRGEDKTSFALRPEFTPTLARMVAAKANALPRPIKWFSIPRCYRAERPQKGRLREFIQWNVDMLGGETPEARRQYDLETAALCLDALREFGLTNQDVKLLWNDRGVVEKLFSLGGVPSERYSFAFHLLDRLAKLSAEQRQKHYAENSISDKERAFFEKLAAGASPLQSDFWEQLGSDGDHDSYVKTVNETQQILESTLNFMGLDGFAQYDAAIVRGLAYYTGFVFEVVDARGENRAVAGGGRYDKLIEMFGGPSLPAVGFGMGDVVLEILLNELKKLPASSLPRPSVFVVNALPDAGEATRILAALRTSTWNAEHTAIVRPGLHAVTSSKSTKNIGKLVGEASQSGALFAIILAPEEWNRGVVKMRDLSTREETEVPAADIIALIQAKFSR